MSPRFNILLPPSPALKDDPSDNAQQPTYLQLLMKQVIPYVKPPVVEKGNPQIHPPFGP
jgi:hypothetical protein